MRRWLITFLCSVWLTSVVCGPSINAERLPIKIYTSADGLGSGFVDFLMRDSRGFMWFCTRDGLSRFDGARLVNYRVGNKQSPPGIERIAETSGGVYWITTIGGMFRFRANTPSLPDNSADRPFLNAEFVASVRGGVLEDRFGNIWYMNNDLFRLIDRNGKVDFERTTLGLWFVDDGRKVNNSI